MSDTHEERRHQTRRVADQHLACEQDERIAQIELNQGGQHSDLAVLKVSSESTQKTVEEIYKRLFQDNGVDSFQTMFRKGTARMDEQDRELARVKAKLLAHEERPKKILGFYAIVIPLVIAVGTVVYKVACCVIDNFKWS